MFVVLLILLVFLVLLLPILVLVVLVLIARVAAGTRVGFVTHRIYLVRDCGGLLKSRVCQRDSRD